MKGSKMYILAVAVLAVVLIAIQVRLPHKFSWEETHDPDDREPYGCFVFDSIMRQTMPKGYEVRNIPVWKLCDESVKKKQNVLVAASLVSLSYDDARRLKKLAESGSNIILAARNTDDLKTDSALADVFGVKFCSGSFVSESEVLRAATNGELKDVRDTIHWNGDMVFPKRDYCCYSFITNDYLAVFSDKYSGTTLARSDEKVVAYRMKIGKGSIVFVSTSLAFTNYGVMSRSIDGYAMRLMSQIANRHVVRTTVFNPSETSGHGGYQSPTGYFVKDPPLRLALLTAFGSIILFMVFNARRRQRAIPLLSEKKSNSLEFTQLIGSLYWQSHDNVDLVRKKYQLFCERIRSVTGADLLNIADDEPNFGIISRHTGISADEIRRMILDVRMLTFNETGIADAEMKKAIDGMDRIESKL